MFKGLRWLRAIERAGVQRIAGIESLQANGNGRLESVEYQLAGQRVIRATGLLLVHDGVIPQTHLSMAADCQHSWNPLQCCWQPVVDAHGASSQPDVSIVGDAAAIAGADAALHSGRIVGWRVACRLGRVDEARCRSETEQAVRSLNRIRTVRDFLDHHYRPFEFFQLPGDDDTIVCRCEQVKAGEIRAVAAMGCMGPNQAKAFTRCGMGPCMGRQCGNAVARLLAQCHGRGVAEIGHYRIRSPVRPLTVGQLANLRTP